MFEFEVKAQRAEEESWFGSDRVGAALTGSRVSARQEFATGLLATLWPTKTMLQDNVRTDCSGN